VNRVFVSFPITDFQKIKLQVLNWASRFAVCCLLDSNEYQLPHHSHGYLLAAGAIKTIEANAGNAFDQLKSFADQQQDWLFGHFGFDLKNELEQVSSSHPDHVHFPDLFFFIPETIIELDKDRIHIGSLHSNHENIFKQILELPAESSAGIKKINPIHQRFSRAAYIESVEALRQHILRGDCYEVNFCQEFYAEDCLLEPVHTYHLLSQASPMPFAAFYKLVDKYLFCASPERYLRKKDGLLLSQPMKGTWPRNSENVVLDKQYKEELFNSAKDRSENVMVVDLVRNDLSKVCSAGSVKVDELYGVYSFPLLHQMVSTISGQLTAGTHWVDAIRATFPMGSMSGAPKKRVLELIEQYEKTRRGLFSGAIGYVSPNGDFDFNVVIRSILYNQRNHYLSYEAGSGITFYSDAQKEYEECLLKAAAIKKVLAG
jgi:para-aminobenzoate synthetase component 1